MCGIAGALVFTSGSFEITPAYVERLRDAMPHRGPDGVGLWVSDDRRVGFGHRRLAIIDLSPCAAQPMANHDGTLQLVFNGEIYNHAELRTELEQLRPGPWKTDHSDTEVILRAFEAWGIDCVHRFRGMFAFAIWDGRARELWLVRDRIGIKPLYYAIHHGRVTFASEIKALLEDPDQPRAVNETALFHYLSFLTTPAPQTLFDGIRKLPGGCWLRVSADGDLREQRYWDVWDEAAHLEDDRESVLAERIIDELRVAVRLRKISDVPVGVFLSGGIDSSTNAALFSEGETTPVRTFSIAYDDSFRTYPSELPFARTVATAVGSEHHEYLVSARDVVEFLPRMIELQDEPIADPVCVPLFYVAQLARQHGVVVCQVGEGADELFIGYPSWLDALRRQQLDDVPVPAFAKRLACAGLAAAGYDRTVQVEWLRRGARGEPMFWSGAEAFTDAEKRRLVAPALRRVLHGVSSWDAIEPIRTRFEARAPRAASTLDWMSYADLNLRLPELLLMRVDKMTMGVSLEGRVPFLDHRFVGLAMSIPSALKVKNGTLKHLLKRAVRGLIPDDIIDRPKQGFGVPVGEIFDGALGPIAGGELSRFCRDAGLLDAAEVRRVLETADPAKRWYLLNLALWWRRFIAREPIALGSA
jgi:asparagine synthase (glutamine-hydrolysing)